MTEMLKYKYLISISFLYEISHYRKLYKEATGQRKLMVARDGFFQLNIGWMY